MLRYVSYVILGLFLASFVFTLPACNTVRGMGKDTKETGEFMTGTPPREAYHQSARDF